MGRKRQSRREHADSGGRNSLSDRHTSFRVFLAHRQAGGQLAEGFGLDLPHAFAGQAQRLADFLERARLVVVQAEPHPQHGRLARVHRLQHAA